MWLWLRHSVEEALRRDGTCKAPLETGGVLMGYQQADAYVVTACIGPGPKAIHKRASFIPDYDYQEQEIARVYRDSGRVFTYLGDWHTHPDGRIRLSAIDRKTLKRIAGHPAARIHNPVMMILAGGNPWRFGAWRWCASVLRPVGWPRSVAIRTWD